MKLGKIRVFWLVLLLGLLPCSVFADELTISWDRSSDPSIQEYRVYTGKVSRLYGLPVSAGNETTYTIKGLEPDTTYYVSLTAVDSSGNESGYSEELVIRTAPLVYEVLITNLQVHSGKSYVVETGGLKNLSSGAYIDRAYVFDNVPDFLLGSVYLKTANADKHSTGSSFISFDVDRKVTVYVAFEDQIVARPAWLLEFEDTGLDLTISGSGRSIFSKSFPAGKIYLGGNVGAANMYNPIVVAREEKTKTVVTISTPVSGGRYETLNSTIDLTGSASGDGMVQRVIWSNSTGGGGTAQGTDDWTISGISLAAGDNTIVVTASDDKGNQASAELLVVYGKPDVVTPELKVIEPTALERVTVDTSTIDVAGTASDDVGISRVSWSGTAGSGTATGTESWRIDGVTLNEGENVFTITAFDDAGNSVARMFTVVYEAPAGTPPDTTPPSAEINITNLSAASGRTYKLGEKLANGSIAYVDRSYTYKNVPAFLEGESFIITANGDKYGRGSSYITFDVDADVAIYVAFDDRISPRPAWLDDFTDTGFELVSADLPLSLYRKTFPAGSVALGGNEGGMNMYTVIIEGADVAAPKVVISAPASGGSYETLNPTIDLSGSATDNVGVEQVTWSNSAGESGTAKGLDNWTISGVSLADGENTVVVTAYDGEGNKASAELIVVYTKLDTVPPELMVVEPTALERITVDTSTIDIAGTATDDVGISRVSWSGTAGSGTAVGTESWRIDGMELSEGENVFTITAFDDAGNSLARTLAVVYEAPPEPLPEPPPSGGIINITNLSAASGRTYKLGEGLANGSLAYVDRSYKYKNVPDFLLDDLFIMTANGDKFGRGSSYITFDVDAAVTIYVAFDNRISSKPAWLGDFTDTGFDLISADLPMGLYRKTFPAGRVVLGGNEGGMNMYTVIIEGSAVTVPKVVISGPASGGSYETGSPTIDLSGSATDNGGVEQVTWSNSTGGSGTAEGLENWTISGISLAEGNNSIVVTAYNGEGNQASAELIVVYIKPDTESPEIMIVEPTSQTRLAVETSTIDLSGSATDNVGVEQVTWSNSTGGRGRAEGLESWTVSGIPLAEGDNTLVLTAYDGEGNQASVELIVAYIKPDMVPPELMVVEPTVLERITVDTARIDIAGTASDDVGISRVSWSGTAGSGAATGTESWRIDGMALNEGENVFTISAFDDAGNSVARMLTVVYEVPPEPTPPSGELVNITNLSVASGRTYRLGEGLANGSLAYVDRSYKYRNVPDFLQDAPFIMTANGDKFGRGSSYIAFDVDADVEIYVAFDDRISPRPAWLDDFTDTGFELISADLPMGLYRKTFPAGRVVLGGNEGGMNMYTVIVGRVR